MKNSAILAIIIALIIAIPIGITTAVVVPEKITIIEERCEITTDDAYTTVKLMYRYQVEDYHYETTYGYHYGTFLNSDGELEYGLHLGLYEEKVHDGWHDEEETIASFAHQYNNNRWIRAERCFIRIGLVESSEFEIEANNIYVVSVADVSVHIDNSLTEAVDYPVYPELIAFGLGVLTILIGYLALKSPAERYLYRKHLEEIERKRLKEIELIKREYGAGYKEY